MSSDEEKTEVKPPFSSEIGGPCSFCGQQKPTRSVSVMGSGYCNICDECYKK